MAKKRRQKRKPRKYSRLRFRIAVLLLTASSIALFYAGASLVYHTVRFSQIVDAKLQGKQVDRPSQVYASPFELRKAQRLSSEELTDVLNALGYRRESSAQPGTFEEASGEIRIRRTGRLAAPVGVTFEQLWISELRELRSGVGLSRVELEPVPVATLFGENRTKRRWVALASLPDHVVHAVLATEDRRFFDHTGLDPIGILRALVNDVWRGEMREGGSTISQQLVKNYFLTSERTVRRKLLEAYLAIILESRTSKEAILELYLNDVYLGQRGSFGIHGVGQAARIFFGKDARNLSIGEAAVIAATIRSPNSASPFSHRERAEERRDIVLAQMANAGFITEEEAKRASARALTVRIGTVDRGEAPFFVDALRKELLTRLDVTQFSGRGLQVSSTMDLYLQNAAQRAVAEGLEEIAAKLGHKGQPQAALVALNPHTGDVLAMVGARSYGESQFNRATSAHRQPGSAFKPFVYLAAFETTRRRLGSGAEVFTPASFVVDEPTTFRMDGRAWRPQNYTRRFEGRVSYRRAVALSLNVATARVGEKVGFESVVDLWEQMGMSSKLEPYPSLVLGAFEVTPLELATAYAVLANGGRRVEPRMFTSVTDGDGRVLLKQPVEQERVASAESAYLVTEMLKSVISFGTAREIRARGFRAEAAGKTGTTNDTRDAWFVGYTPDVLAAVWVGYDDNRPLALSGSQAALPVWTRFMKAAVSGREKHRFEPPGGIVFASIDPGTGKRSTPACPSPQREAFLKGTEPLESCPLH